MLDSLASGLSIKNGYLFWHERNLYDMAKKFKTPLIVYSKEDIINNYTNINNSISKYFTNYEIKYAIKANNNKYILRLIKNLGAGVDASSKNEIIDAINSGFKSSKISFSPNNVSPEELEFALNNNININFDSLNQYRLIKNKDIKSISFRIKTDYGKGEFKGITTSGKGSKFGEIPKNALEGYKEAKENGCKNFGMHIMAGSNVRDYKHFKKVTNDILNIAINFENKLNIKFDYIDIGGGFGIPYRPNENILDIDKSFEKIFNAFKSKYKNDFPELIIEPGRYLTGNAGIILGTVYDIKKHEINYVGTDIGMNVLIRPALYGAYHHIEIVNKIDKIHNFKCDVTGQICENTDRIGKNILLPEPSCNDIIAVFSSGSYVQTMASHYNGREIPEELLLLKTGERIIKKREIKRNYNKN